LLATCCLRAVAQTTPATTTGPASAITLRGFSIEIDGHARQDVGERDRVRIERRVVRGEQSEDVRVYTRIENRSERDISLGVARLVEAEAELRSAGSPAAVFVSGDATLACQPHGPAAERHYGGGGLLALAPAEKNAALVIGFLTAAAARTEVAATYRPGLPTTLSATQRLLGRKLPPGQSIDLDTVYLATDPDPYRALDAYAAAVAAQAHPRKTRAIALWCSWYGHRMDVSEDLVLANAAIVAKYFKPLGLEIMQLDHGWQSGDITGDWTVDRQSFPHGFRWLADELKARYGLKLGLWIAPTDVAETSDLFKQHPDWVLKDGSGKPLVNWRWYWKPNPNCYELDVTIPAAADYVRQTFARLSGEGASYFKIDFIASSGGEQFVQSDPTATRGWTNLRRAMESVRAGAGNDAWIRYCQTPPLLSAHLADSAYGGEDTLDAGRPDSFHALRENARILAAGYWLNDRLYHREVCDMSVRMQADVEEVRLRLAMMTLAGCSISFSDELQHLPMSRIRMMQQCLPPGAPFMRPIDLFDRDVPSIWHLHCKTAADEWDVVGLFNFEDQPRELTVSFASLGLKADADRAVFEFWQQRLLAVEREHFAMTLAPHTSRIVSIRKLSGVPQVVGTDMHVLQGFHELPEVKWDAAAKTLSGRCRRAAGMEGQLFVYVPSGLEPKFDFPLRDSSAHLTHIDGRLWSRELVFKGDVVDWSIPFSEIP
jgi:hypothetical protein